MKNHEPRPTGTTPFLEVNVARHGHYGKSRGRGRTRGHGCGHIYARCLGFYHSRNGNHKSTSFHHKWKMLKRVREKKGQSSKTSENSCYHCGEKGH